MVGKADRARQEEPFDYDSLTVEQWKEMYAERCRLAHEREDALAAELAAAEKENKRLCDIVEKTADGHLLEQLAAVEKDRIEEREDRVALQEQCAENFRRAEAAEKATDDERRIVHELRDRVMALKKRNGELERTNESQDTLLHRLFDAACERWHESAVDAEPADLHKWLGLTWVEYATVTEHGLGALAASGAGEETTVTRNRQRDSS